MYVIFTSLTAPNSYQRQIKMNKQINFDDIKLLFFSTHQGHVGHSQITKPHFFLDMVSPLSS